MRSGNPSPRSSRNARPRSKSAMPPKPRKASKPRTELKEFEHEMSGQLAAVGKEMAEKYDLSEETAKAKSAGVKGFQVAQAAGCQGLRQTRRHAARRLGRGRPLYLLSARQRHRLARRLPAEGSADRGPRVSRDRAAAHARWRQAGGRGSPALATEAQKQSADSGLAFKDLPSAAAAFDAALAKITA